MIGYALFEENPLAKNLFQSLSICEEKILWHHFPDGETLCQFPTLPHDHEALVFADLWDPNPKILPFLFAIDTLRQHGIKQITLVVPYLPYMRQDTAFRPGECVSATALAKLLSTQVDALVTIDLHLHRIHQLQEIYTIPTLTIHAAPRLADWISENIPDPLLIGPDAESQQWVASIADRIHAPYRILEKTRLNDESVTINLRDSSALGKHTPVLVDDMISTGHTIAEAAKVIQNWTKAPLSCLCIHALFTKAAGELMKTAGVKQIFSTNSVIHPTNAIDLSADLAQKIRAKIP